MFIIEKTGHVKNRKKPLAGQYFTSKMNALDNFMQICQNECIFVKYIIYIYFLNATTLKASGGGRVNSL